MKDLWVEKYRPNSIDTYVFRDDNQKKQVAGWKEDGALPHLLFLRELRSLMFWTSILQSFGIFF